MEDYIRKSMNDSIIDKAALLYTTDRNQISLIGGFENFVYEFKTNNKAFIMRFIHSGHREYTQVLAELEFIDYLDQNEARVSTVVNSIHGNIVEKIILDPQSYFTVCVFEKAPGQKVSKEDLTDEFYIMFGSEVGKLHRLTKSYIPKHKRIEWTEDNLLHLGGKFLQQKDHKIINILGNLVKKINNLPKNINNYGLIHTDLHFGNMFICGGELTFFDWDDASYKHFISDVAIVLFYHFVYSNDSQDDINIKSQRILALFLEGYTKENSFDFNSLQYLNDFLQLRMIILYIAIYAMGENADILDFRKYYTNKYRRQIMENIPFLDLDLVLKGL